MSGRAKFSGNGQPTAQHAKREHFGSTRDIIYAATYYPQEHHENTEI